MSLRTKWFPTAAEKQREIEEAQAATNAIREQIAQALATRYMQDFRKWLEAEAIKQDPRPGESSMMSYQCGVRDGIRLVSVHLNAAEKFASEIQ